MVMCGEPGSAEAVDLSQDSLRDGDGNSNTSSVEVKGENSAAGILVP